MGIESLTDHYNKIADNVSNGLYPPSFFNSGYNGCDFDTDEYDQKYKKFCAPYVHLLDEYKIATDNRSLLEVGCGFGRGCFFLKKRYNLSSIVGCDINPNIIAIAKQHYTKNNFVIGDINNLQTINKLFDVVLTIETEYYWHNNPNIAQSFASVVKPGGDLLIATDVRKTRSISKKLYGFRLVDEKDITENVLQSLTHPPQMREIYKKRIEKLQTTHHYVSQHYTRE